MKYLLLALSLITGSAFANGVDNMVAQCQEVMRCEECRVANDKSQPGATKLISYLDVNGVTQSRRVLMADYDYIRNTGYTKTKAGTFQMCDRVRTVMKNPESEKAMGARAMFSKDWVIGTTRCPVIKK